MMTAKSIPRRPRASAGPADLEGAVHALDGHSLNYKRTGVRSPGGSGVAHIRSPGRPGALHIKRDHRHCRKHVLGSLLLTLVNQYANGTPGSVTSTSLWVMIAEEVTNLVAALSPLICLAIGACLWLLVRSARLAASELPTTTDWLEDLSIERYRPMLRLLDEEDLRLLRQQPGFTPRMAARFRAQRCRMVRGYLRSMQVDFARICTALKILMAQSQHDRPDLASALIRTQITFTLGMVAVQFRLFL